jgi:integrin beta 8
MCFGQDTVGESRAWVSKAPYKPLSCHTGGAREPQFISRDWHGVPGKVDAAMTGRIYISGSALRPPQAKKQKSRRRSRKRYSSRGSRGRGHGQNSRRPSRSVWMSLFSSEESGLGAFNYDDYDMNWLVPATCEPIQSVYFFSGGGSPCYP